MAIWIDPPRWPAHGRMWSHLISDTSITELHAFARALGIPQRSFEGDHYDVPQERYDALVAAGARPVSGTCLARMLRDSGLRFRKRRGEHPLGRIEGALAHLGVPHRLDLIASSAEPPAPSTRAAVVFVSDARRRVLLVHSVVRGEWHAPAGGREPGESVRECAARELWEETGLSAPAEQLRPIGYERITVDVAPLPGWAAGDNHIACFALHLAQDGPALAPVLSDVDGAAWVSAEDAHARCGHQPWWPLMQRSLGTVD